MNRRERVDPKHLNLRERNGAQPPTLGARILQFDTTNKQVCLHLHNMPYFRIALNQIVESASIAYQYSVSYRLRSGRSVLYPVKVYGIVSFRIVSHHPETFRTVSYRIVWAEGTQDCIISDCLVSYHISSCRIVMSIRVVLYRIAMCRAISHHIAS